jgi:raffinose/stachyose/melibiose transport system permease protein/N-acetylglucosamine transport system permease protein
METEKTVTYPILPAKKERVKRTKVESIVIWSAFILFSIYAITLIYPFLYIFLNSFRSNWEIASAGRMAFPKKFDWKFYEQVLNEYPFHEYFFNSVTLTLGQTVIGMLMTCMTSYTLAKYKFRGNEFLYTFVIVAGMIPTLGALPATYKLMSDTQLMDTYIGMIFMTCGGFGGYFLYLHSFFKAIPWSYAESAMLDGASDFRIFAQIMMPMVKNGIVAFTIIQFLSHWNEFWTPYMFYESHPTIAVGLNILDKESVTAKKFAGILIATVPVIIAYIIFQRKIMENSIGGGLKG